VLYVRGAYRVEPGKLSPHAGVYEERHSGIELHAPPDHQPHVHRVYDRYNETFKGLALVAAAVQSYLRIAELIHQLAQGLHFELSQEAWLASLI